MNVPSKKKHYLRDTELVTGCRSLLHDGFKRHWLQTAMNELRAQWIDIYEHAIYISLIETPHMNFLRSHAKRMNKNAGEPSNCHYFFFSFHLGGGCCLKRCINFKIRIYYCYRKTRNLNFNSFRRNIFVFLPFFLRFDTFDHSADAWMKNPKSL